MAKHLEKINFIGSTVQKNNAYRSLVTCWASDFQYEQAKEVMRRKGYYLPASQYGLFCRLLDLQMQIDQQEIAANAA